MKTKTWITLLAAVTAVCLGLSLCLLQPGKTAGAVRVISQGKVLHTLSLSEDREIEVTTDRGTNVVTIKDGKVAVTRATCPDGYCMDRGFCSGGTQIVCLPNRVVVTVVNASDTDAPDIVV